MHPEQGGRPIRLWALLLLLLLLQQLSQGCGCFLMPEKQMRAAAAAAACQPCWVPPRNLQCAAQASRGARPAERSRATESGLQAPHGALQVGWVNPLPTQITPPRGHSGGRSQVVMPVRWLWKYVSPVSFVLYMHQPAGPGTG